MTHQTQDVLDWFKDPANEDQTDDANEFIDDVLRDSARLGWTRDTETDQVATELCEILVADARDHGGRELVDLDMVSWNHIARTFLDARRALPENADITRTADEYRIEVPTVLHFTVRAMSEPEALAYARDMLQYDPDNIFRGCPGQIDSQEGLLLDLWDGYIGLSSSELRSGLPNLRVVNCVKQGGEPRVGS